MRIDLEKGEPRAENVYAFIHSLDRYFLVTYNVPDTVLAKRCILPLLFESTQPNANIKL